MRTVCVYWTQSTDVDSGAGLLKFMVCWCSFCDQIEIAFESELLDVFLDSWTSWFRSVFVFVELVGLCQSLDSKGTSVSFAV